MVRPAYPIDTERLSLRPLTRADLDAVHAWEQRPDVHRYLYSEPRTRDGVAEMLVSWSAMTGIDDDSEAIRLGVVVRASGDLVGDVNLRRISKEHRQGEIGFVFHPDHHGHGYATEAARELLRYGFEEARLHRIVGRCDGRNAGSARVMDRLGMRLEAHLVENEWIKGQWTDELVYAMLAGEWSARAGGMSQEEHG